MSKKNTVRVLALVLALMMMVGALAGCTATTNTKVEVNGVTSETTETGSGAKTVTFVVNHGDGSTHTYTLHTDAATLGEALLKEEIIAGQDSQYGLFVTTVDGETADDAKQEWWCLTKGGKEWMNGVDTTDIADGEAYEFTLTVGY